MVKITFLKKEGKSVLLRNSKGENVELDFKKFIDVCMNANFVHPQCKGTFISLIGEDVVVLYEGQRKMTKIQNNFFFNSQIEFSLTEEGEKHLQEYMQK